MLQPRWRKIVRDLCGNKLRTALVVLSIAVGVFAIGVIASARVILGRDLDGNYAAVAPASATIFTDYFADDLVQVVRNMPAVHDAEGRSELRVRIKTGPDQWRDLQLTAIHDYADMRVDKIRHEAGAWPPGKGDLLIERASLAYTGAQIGDIVQVKTANGEERSLRVTGLVYNPQQPEATIAGSATGYITLDTYEWLGSYRGMKEMRFVVAGDTSDRTHIEAVAEQVREKIKASDRQIYGTWVPTPGKHPASDIIQTLLLILGAIGALALFLSGFLVVNTISAVLAQHVRQIGMMKAIGARGAQIVWMYVGMVLALGLLSLLVAVPAGAVGAWALVRYIASVVNFNVSDFRVPPQVLALQVAIGIGVPLLASLWPVVVGSRVTVREAISNYGIAEGKRKKEKRIAGSLFAFYLLPFAFSRPLLLSLRNTFRRKGRLALTLIALTLGGAIFMSVISVRESLFRTLDQASNYWKYDVFVNFNRFYRVEEIEAEALRVPGFVQAESWGRGSARRVRRNDTESRNIAVVAPPAATTFIEPIVLQGRWLLPNDESAIVINSDLLEDEPDIKVGDELTLKLNGGEEKSWRVVGLVKGYLIGPRIYINYSYFARTAGQMGRAGNVRVLTEQHDPLFQQQVARDLEARYEGIGWQVESTITSTDDLAPVVSQFNILIIFLLIMALLLAVVGGLGLMGTMSINVIERTREIGVMRAVGASNGAVQRIVIVEGILNGILSWLIGALLAIPLSRLLSDQVGIAFLQDPLSYTFSFAGVLVWLLLVILLAAVASFLPAWQATRLSVRDVLAYE